MCFNNQVCYTNFTQADMTDPNTPINSALEINDNYYTVDIFNGTDEYANLDISSNSTNDTISSDNEEITSDVSTLEPSISSIVLNSTEKGKPIDKRPVKSYYEAQTSVNI